MDPVATKELRSVSRRWQMYVGRCIFVAITAYLLYEYWKSSWRGVGGRPGFVSVSSYAEVAREIFIRCEWVSLALTVVAAVIAGSDMLAREIRNGTLSLLFLTSLTPARVVLGKWKGTMMIAFALYLCGLPVLAIAVYLGGVGPVDLIRSAAWTLGLAAVASSVSIYFSARLKSGGAAVAASLTLMVPMLLGFAAFDLMGDLVLQALIKPASIIHKGGAATTLFALLMCILYLNLAIHHVGRKVGGAVAGPADLARERRALALEEVRDRRASKPRRILTNWRAVWDGNPLLWKEFTLRPALRVREDWRMRAYALLFLFFVASWVFSGLRGGNGFFQFWGAFFTVVALAGGSLLFAPEKEGRQWLLLLSTPVTAVQVVRAKLLCGLIFPEAAGLLLLYFLALAAWLGMQNMFTFLVIASVATLFILFAYSLAAAASLRCRTARAAFLFAGGIVAFLLTVPPLLSAAGLPLGPSQGAAWNALWSWIEALDPITVLDSFEVDRRHWDIPAHALNRALRFLAIYLPATLMLPVEMVLRFRRIATRA